MRATHIIPFVAMLTTLAMPVRTAEAGQNPRAQIVIQYDRSGGRPDGPPRRAIGRVDLAVTIGYRDGYTEGFNDGRHHHRDNPYGESRFKHGDHGFDRRYGDRDRYRMNYRDAFWRGYERGYQEGWRR
ncbi:MAG TPA: hypothetical protein VLT86_13730 [Vicinamibacterales bacterium]|nr:hypothetical protein [Vicinamibacterales bacterium]